MSFSLFLRNLNRECEVDSQLLHTMDTNMNHLACELSSTYLFWPTYQDFFFQNVIVVESLQNMSWLWHEFLRVRIANQHLKCSQKVLLGFGIAMHKLKHKGVSFTLTFFTKYFNVFIQWKIYITIWQRSVRHSDFQRTYTNETVINSICTII